VKTNHKLVADVVFSTLKKDYNSNMKKEELKWKGKTYTVSSTTTEGLKKAVKEIKKALKQNEKTKEEDGV